MPQQLNRLISAEQERLRSIVATMAREEYPLATTDLKNLMPFVKRVRSETVESTTPGQRGIHRTDYYVLNELGRDMYRRWERGELDKHVG